MGVIEVLKEGKISRLRTIFSLIFACALLYIVLVIEHEDVFHGFLEIIKSPAILITDYLEIGGIGATFLNAFLVFSFNLFLMKILDVKIKGLAIAAFFMLFGFSFFGKNIFNILPFYLGGILYSKYANRDFREIIVTIFFTSALAPYVSAVAFKLDANKSSYIAAVALGVIIGFIVVPIAEKMAGFHEGYNLYNLGFTAGIMGAVISAILQAYNFEIVPQRVISERYHTYLVILCFICFVSFIAIGYIVNGNNFKGYGELLKDTGLKVDFVMKYGYGLTFINMGIMGFVSLLYVMLFKQPLSGPLLAGVLGVAGFGAYGKHIRNTVPILIGVAIGSIYSTDNYFLLVLSALFGTALAPIAGEYGVFWGIIAGWMHFAVTRTIGQVHGGLNLYNNGFSAGIVAGVMLPIMRMVGSIEDNRKKSYLIKKRGLYESMKAFKEHFIEEIIEKEDSEQDR